MKKRVFVEDQQELTAHDPSWCPGCGDFSIWIAIKKAIVALGIDPEKVVIVYGVGCAGNMSNTINVYGFHGLHGRPVPVATGTKLANHGLTVIAISGDGDAYGEGLGHMIHAMRGNHDITYIVHNNQTYGLTTGQTSPTSDHGAHSKTTPDGAIEDPVNPIAIALDAGATYVARGFSGDNPQLTQLLINAIKHRGFSFVDVFQPCVTFNQVNTYKWFFDKVYKLEDKKHDTTDKSNAWLRANDLTEGFPTGLFYEAAKVPYHEQVVALKKGPLAQQPMKIRDMNGELKKYQ